MSTASTRAAQLLHTLDEGRPPAPGSPQWLQLVTASKVAAILGVSPYESPRSLWHRMRNELPNQPQTKDMSRGHYLEAGVLAWWKDQHNLIGPVLTQHYATLPDMAWAAATLDALVTDDMGNTIVVEVKTSARADEWGSPGTDEIPAYYAAQIMWQLAMVPDAHFACVAVLLGPGLDLVEFVVQRDDDLIAAIVERCHGFYVSLMDDDAAPDLDDHVATFEAIRALHPDITPAAEAELTREQAAEFLDSGDVAKASAARERAAKTVVLDVMAKAQYGVCGGLRVARRQPSKNGVALYTATKTRLTKGETA